MHELISLKNSIEKGDKFYFTGKPCKAGHIELRYVSSRQCSVCIKLATDKRYATNPDYMKDWHKANRERCLAYLQKWRKRNPDYNKKCVEANPEKYLALKRRHSAKRRRTVEQQILAMSDLELLELSILYDEAALLGPDWHVDHIIPLSKGGEHRPYNMQLVRSDYNQRKSAKELYTPADLGKYLPAYYAESLV
jgi:5-methylcytosine-specific restriction endonuclease McrA